MPYFRLVRACALVLITAAAIVAIPSNAIAHHCDANIQCTDPAHAPVVALTADHTTVQSGTAITFTASVTDEDPQDSAAFQWRFGANAQYEQGSATMSRTLPAGTHVVTVQVTDQQQKTATAEITVTVTAPPVTTPPPSAAFTVSTPKPVAAKALAFDASSSIQAAPGVTIVKYEWDLNGNGSFETSCAGPAAVASFGTGGTKPVLLKVTDSAGGVSTVEQSVAIGAGTASKFAASALKPTATSCGGGGANPSGFLTPGAPPEGVTCFTTIHTGIAELMAPCFQRTIERLNLGTGTKSAFVNDEIYTALGKVRLNGIDIKPRIGVSIKVDTFYHRVQTEGGSNSATASLNSGVGLLGNVTFFGGAIDWKLPAGKTARFRLGNVSITKGAQLLGLDVEGDAALDLVYRGAELPITMHLPKPVDVSAQVTLKTDNMTGLRLDDIHLRVENAKFGAFDVKALDLRYSVSAAQFDGSALLFISSVGQIDVKVQVVGKVLTIFSATYDAYPPIALGSGVFLQRINFDYNYGPPLTLQGGVRVTAGPPISGKSVAAINGTLKYVASSPWLLRADGNAEIAGVGMATAYVEYRSNGMFRMGGAASGTFYDIVSASGSVGFWLYTPTGQFNAEGAVEVCVWKGCGGGAVVISNVGIGGCVYTFFADFGMGYRWGDSVKFFLTGCDIGTWRSAWAGDAPARLRSHARADAVTSEDVDIKAGQRAAFIRIAGDGAPPRVKVTGPDGTTIETPEGTEAYVTTKTYNVLQVPPHKATYVMVAHPAAGRWKVEALPGSPGIVGIHSAAALPKPSVSATVTGSGHARRLAYKVTAADGQLVRFVERAGDMSRTIGTSRGGTGSIAFAPGDGKAGTRTIVAQVEQDGMPRTNLKVASYRAPGPIVPARPARVTVTRTARAATISWTPAKRAKRYLVIATVADGRRFSLTTTKRTLRLADIVQAKVLRASAQGLRADGTPGPAARQVSPTPRRRR